MLELIESLSDYYIIFSVIAIFSILALVGYLYETKSGKKAIQPKKYFATAVNTDVEALKNSVANKTLNTAVTNNVSKSSNEVADNSNANKIGS